ncbi:unnamed protein product [Arctia plantaginis]|uniref:Uncharacterized protein n=1 Tax=Arctia plantaginis TaxID=874455 RepID=A0A8S0Z5Z9_ARCPL|nr:unnamed protein product [Arctia plantaginis]
MISRCGGRAAAGRMAQRSARRAAAGVVGKNLVTAECATSLRPERGQTRENSPKFGVFSKRHTMRPQDLQKPLLQQNLADALLLKVHNNNEFHKDKEAQANRRSEYVQGVERNTVKEIQQVLHDHNI